MRSICGWGNKKMGVSILVILYRMILDISYFNVITPVYVYSGFENHMNANTLIVSWVFLFISLWFINSFLNENNTRGSENIMSFIYLISFIPLTTCICAGIISEGCILWSMIYYFVLFGTYTVFHEIKERRCFLLKLSSIEIGKGCIFCICCICVCTVIYISYTYASFRLNFDLDMVYELRREASNYTLPVIIVYLHSMSRTVIPLLFAYFLTQKRFPVCGLLFITQCLSFGIDGSKSAFYMMFFAMYAVFIFKIIPKIKTTDFIFITLFAILLFGIIEYSTIGSCWIDGRIVRRFMFVPAQLHEIYYDFFTIYEPDYLRGSFLRHFGFVSPYASFGSIAFAIGSFMGKPEVGANNGLFSDAIATGGLSGILLFPLIIVLVGYIFDLCIKGLPREVVLIAAFQTSFSFISSSIGTVLFTHGLLLILFCTAAMSRRNYTYG